MIRKPKATNDIGPYRIILGLCAIILCLIIICYTLIEESNDYEAKEETLLTREKEKGSINNKEVKKVNDELFQKDAVKLKPRTIDIKGISSQNLVSLHINDELVYEKRNESDRGIHLIVLNEFTGAIILTKSFDTVYYGNEQYHLRSILKDMRPDTITILMVKDDATWSLKEIGRNALKALGSTKINQLRYRGRWIFISREGKTVYESVLNNPVQNVHAGPLMVKRTLRLRDIKEFCQYGVDSAQEKKRRDFCFSYLGFNSMCNCTHPSPIQFRANDLIGNRMKDVPISIVASNRPHYLHRMLTKLLSIKGISRNMVTVYIDGFYDQVVAMLDVLEVKFIEHPRSKCDDVCKIHQSYKMMLDSTAARYPHAEFMMILEEDLLVADDFMDYFNQLLPVLSSDESLLCISAWNDHGFKHSTHDPAMVYRVETMPGLGWMVKRDLYVKELAPIWPKPNYRGDWDMWLRMIIKQKRRECLIPDISRTFHFGKIGTHSIVYENENQEYEDLFVTRLNSQTGNKFNVETLYKDEYEKHIHNLVKNAQVLDHSKDPCNKNTSFIPPTKNIVYVMYIKWRHDGDAETWLNLAKCFRLWYVDVRGVHKHMWRFWMKGNHVFVVSNRSPYFIYKPKHVEPIFISNERVGNKEKYDMDSRQGYQI